MSSKIIIRRNPDYGKCPSCSTFDSLRRSHSRTTVEHLVNHVSYFRTFRCKKCGWRGYLSTLSITSKSFKKLFLYLIMGAASALLIRTVLSKYF